MPALYPFLMLPEFHERVWGTRDLRPYFSRVVEAEPIGEVWLTGEACRVANGPLAGQTLRDLAAATRRCYYRRGRAAGRPVFLCSSSFCFPARS